MTMPWMRIMVDSMGQADLEELLDRKLEAVSAAKLVARELEAEYDELLQAAAESKHHPRAKLRKTIGDGLREVLNRPSMMEQARADAVAAGIPDQVPE